MFRVEELKDNLVREIEVDVYKKFVKVVDENDSNNFCILSEKMIRNLDGIKSMKIYSDDVWIITNPKCGTTWVKEMVKLIRYFLW